MNSKITAKIIEGGKYKMLPDGTAQIKEKGDILGVEIDDIIGFTYKIESTTNVDKEIPITLEYHYEDGQVSRRNTSVETNALFGTIIHIKRVEDIGEITFKVLFENKPELTLQHTFMLYDKQCGLLFGNKRFTKASTKAIQDFENKYQVLLCDDYKNFLQTQNGLDTRWWRHMDYGVISKFTRDWDWLYETDYIFGLGNKNPYLDMSKFHMQNLFYHNDLVKYAYPVGVDGGGNTLLQIAQGKHRGKLAMLDHEVSVAMLDWIEGKTENVYSISPEKATADGFLEDCFEYGGLTFYDLTFEEFLKELTNKHLNVFNTIKEQ